MSTVLTNGVIIPENGSRNWGGDLANNWNILDVNVGYMNDVKNSVTTLENSKQDVIEDLETIRAGASSGATAVQPSVLSNYLPLSGGSITGNLLVNSNSDGWKPGFEWLYNNKRFAYIHAFTDEAVSNKSLNVQADNFLQLISQNLIFSISRTNADVTYSNALNFQCATDGTFKFYSNTPANLGTSTNKWKTLNGVNPGALSLPDCSEGVVVTSQVVNNDGIYQYTNNLYDGWLVVTAIADQARINNQTFECRGVRSTDTVVTVHIPLRLNETASTVFVNFTNFAYVKLFKCVGSV